MLAEKTGLNSHASLIYWFFEELERDWLLYLELQHFFISVYFPLIGIRVFEINFSVIVGKAGSSR